jgi:hypothetical protein
VTDRASDLRVQGLTATVRGGFSDLAWSPPEFDPAARQLVGFELFRDDTSTEPPSRLTWRTVPPNVLEARGLEIVPHGEYGVQAIWRRTTEAEPVAAIEYGPARLIKDLAGPAIVVPAEQRIHSLAFLQSHGAITSAEMELAIDRLLGKAQPPIENAPRPKAVPVAAIAGAPQPRRVAFAYIAIAVVMVLALVAAQQLIGHFLFPKASPISVAASTPSSQPTPSPSPSPTAKAVDLRPVLLKTTDLRAGYVAGPSSSQPLCSACTPAVSSLSVVFRNNKLNRTILTAATVTPASSDNKALAAALIASVGNTQSWAQVARLGDAAFSTSITTQNKTQVSYYVVWRTGAITNEVMLVGPRGALTLQNAIDLAKVQQGRAAKALG